MRDAGNAEAARRWFVGTWLLSALGVNISIGGPIVSQIIVAAIGAIVVILIARLVT